MCFKVAICVTFFTNNVGLSPLYLSIPLFMKSDCVQKYDLIHIEDAVKTVTKVGSKKSHFELPLKEIETVFGGLFVCRIVQWLGRGCLRDGVAGSVSVMKLFVGLFLGVSVMELRGVSA